MQQYERFISYIYQYHGEEKGENVGFAKIERRNAACKISVQLCSVPTGVLPDVYVYRQLANGAEAVYAGKMSLHGGSLLFKAAGNAEKLFQSNLSLAEIDGIFITAGQFIFATSWKRDFFYLGDWKEKQEKTPQTEAPQEAPQKDNENREEKSEEKIETKKEEATEAQRTEKPEEKIETKKEETAETQLAEEPEEKIEAKKEEAAEAQTAEAMKKEPETDLEAEEVSEKIPNPFLSQAKPELPPICGICPFQRKEADYGERILKTLPSMRPFQQDVKITCARMDLQDIGCLPIASWQLSSNRFLLHGYYCYRHLLFAKRKNKSYALGVPGIYSAGEEKLAKASGFIEFASITGAAKQQGAFGYWFFPLPSATSCKYENNR